MPVRVLIATTAAVAAVSLVGCSATPSSSGSAGRVPAPLAAAGVVSVGSLSSVPSSSAAVPTPVQPRPTAVPHVATRAAVNPCGRNRAPQKIIVSIRRQHMWLCAHHRLVRSNPVTTGMVGPDTNTPTGNFRIEGRNRDTTLVLNTGRTYDVKYWIPFIAPLYGFHDSPWQHFPYGSPKYRTRGSHGCVHMPLQAIAFLYRWVARPTAVHIF